MEALRHCLFILSALCCVVHTYGHRSHPRCTRIPASDVYHGTCYFQYVGGKGYVKRTCPSGTRYRQDECACVGSSQNTKATGGVTPNNGGVSGGKSTSVHSLFGGGPLSILKHIFSIGRYDDKDDDFSEHDEREEKENDEGKYTGAGSFEGYRFYGDDEESHESENDGYPHYFYRGSGSRDNGAQYGGKESTDFLSGLDLISLRTGRRGDSDDDYGDDHPSDRDDYGESDNGGKIQTGSSRGDGGISGNGAKAGDGYGGQNDGKTPSSGGIDFFDQIAKFTSPKRGDSTGDSDSEHEREDDDKEYHDDDDDHEHENGIDNSHHLYKHGYGSIYSVKGMLSRHKHYHYEDLYVNLFDHDDDDDDEHDDDDNNGGGHIFENYEKIYDDKLDGVLEYIGDLFDDLFDDDFDDFYEDIFDDDGYDDCFVKRYGHYFDEDFKNEIDEKYDDFDDFFKNYDRIRSMTSGYGYGGDDDDDDEEGDRHTVTGGVGRGDSDDDKEVYDDKNDDRDEGIWSGKGNFDIFENSNGGFQSKAPTDSRLFDFTKTLKRNVNNDPTNVFDVFSQNLAKH